MVWVVWFKPYKKKCTKSSKSPWYDTVSTLMMVTSDRRTHGEKEEKDWITTWCMTCLVLIVTNTTNTRPS